MPDSMPIYIKIVIFLFVFTFLFSVALEKPRGEILKMMKSRLMGRSLLANFILIPILAMIIIWLFKLPIDISVGFLAVAAAPGGLLALNFTRVAKGNLIYAVALVFVLSLLSVIITPIIIALIYPSITVTNVPVRQIMSYLLLMMIPPLLAGQLIQHWFEAIALRIQKVVSFLSIGLFIASNMLTSTLKAFDARTLGWNGLAAIVTLIVAAWIVGWQVGGPDIANRKVLAISTSMRNVAICMLIAGGSMLTQEAEFAIIGFSELLIPMNLVFAFVTSRIKTTP